MRPSAGNINMPHREPTGKKLPHYRNGWNVELGDRVRRGPHWNHGNQDSGIGRIGTVTNIRATGAQSTKIRWDSGCICLYRMGEGNIYELQLVE